VLLSSSHVCIEDEHYVENIISDLSQFKLSQQDLSHRESANLKTSMHLPSFRIRTFPSIEVVTALSRFNPSLLLQKYNP